MNIRPVIYLSEDTIIQLHDFAVARYGGLSGIRDAAALHSCAAQPQTRAFGVERFPDLPEKAAAYCFFVIVAHPFIDGNKRTGFLSALHFLLENGVVPRFDQDEMHEILLRVASGSADLPELIAIFKKGCGEG